MTLVTKLRPLALVAGFLLMASAARSQSQSDMLHRSAVAPPEDLRSGLSGQQESDEIDQEIERYFANLQNTGSTDLDAQRLDRLFGSSGAPADHGNDQSDADTFRFNNQANADDQDMHSHRVATGDTIWNISRRYNVSTDSIVDNNPELRSRPLYIGEEILISNIIQTPAPAALQNRMYQVKRGDTLSSVARRFRLSLAALKRLNNLRSNQLSVGQQLVVGRQSGPPPGYRYEALFEWPLRGVITSGFGRRFNPFVRSATQFHKGLDIGAAMGTPFSASRDGIVIFSGRMGGYGNAIFLRHTNGFVSVYAHCMKTLVQAGDVIKRGQRLGLVGRTGSATGPHLHFEVRKWRNPINPIGALNMRELVRANQVAAR
ncbi:MAG: M23 family metallopeptidase [Leptospirales bacterium]|nr:M23 family metallopeptidase [Leptospirales bacterium]